MSNQNVAKEAAEKMMLLSGNKPIVVTFDEMTDELAVNLGFPATEEQIATVTERLRGASEESD